MDSAKGAIQYRDPARAEGHIARISPDIAEPARPRFWSLLFSSPDPDDVLRYLDRLHREQYTAFCRLVRSRLGLRCLVTVFSYSGFLSEALLREPLWLADLLASRDLNRYLSSEELVTRLKKFLAGQAPSVPLSHSLAVFRRRQILRILLRDLTGLESVSAATEEISNLADAILEVTCRLIRDELTLRYGVPRIVNSVGEIEECGFAVISLGKLGGRELNYSSDIDLMFVYSGNGETDGEERITNKEFFKKVGNQCTEVLSGYSAEGMCYRIDLRLRPEGRLGEICISLEGARHYYTVRARDWELQMMIKARISAGDRNLGRALLSSVEPLIYATTLDFSAVESVAATRDRIKEKLAARRAWSSGFDVKLARGGIRDIEFLVQCLQRLHGGREPWVRHGGTWFALSRLNDKGLLSGREYSDLNSAYEFLRNLEHRLQIAEDRQTHVLPSGQVELEILARKMLVGQGDEEPTSDLLLRQLNEHLEKVQEIYERVIHAQQPMYYSPTAVESPSVDIPEEGSPLASAEPTVSNLVRFLDQRAPHFAARLSQTKLSRGSEHFERFLERVFSNDEWLGWLESDPDVAAHALELIEHSPHFAEELIRNPEFLGELRRLGRKPDSEPGYLEMIADLNDTVDLRRFFRREMFRLQSDSICLHAPIFKTLARTSDLADAVIVAAYRMALEHVKASRPPASADYVPASQMMVITLGRLGMREFDLGSDADLIFVLPDEDNSEMVFWKRVAERMIQVLTSYTGYGQMFAVDTRLRPNGREGELVQSETTYKEYFAYRAQAWEGITYMKCRAVAGDVERATAFLDELQKVDWRRYGQSGRSATQLVQMRMKLQKEQGTDNPLKSAPGGYYDIDFALMYLRLKGAGIFYKVLNTPARIDVIENMGHLGPEEADFLRDAAIFYRAVEHGLRVSSGVAGGKLPRTTAQLERLTELVSRWTPEHLHDEPLPVELVQIRAGTRKIFDKLFVP